MERRNILYYLVFVALCGLGASFFRNLEVADRQALTSILSKAFGLGSDNPSASIPGTRGSAGRKVKTPERVISVWISGAVRLPGFYILKPGARLCDLIKLSGGLAESADPGAVDGTIRLADNSRIRIPSKKSGGFLKQAGFGRFSGPGSFVEEEPEIVEIRETGRPVTVTGETAGR